MHIKTVLNRTYLCKRTLLTKSNNLLWPSGNLILHKCDLRTSKLSSVKARG